MLRCQASKVYVCAGRIIRSNALLVDLRILGQLGEEGSQLFRIILCNRLGWVNARAARQDVKFILEGGYCRLLLPIIIDNSMSTRVQI